MMFSPFAIRSVRMAIAGSPDPLNTPLSKNSSKITTLEPNMMRTKLMPVFNTSGLAPIKRRISSAKMTPIIPVTIPKVTPTTKA